MVLKYLFGSIISFPLLPLLCAQGKKLEKKHLDYLKPQTEKGT